MSESFFSRWSQRKRAQAQGLPSSEATLPEHGVAQPADTLAPPPGATVAKADTATPARSDTANVPGRADADDAPAPALPTLDDVAELTPSSDFQPFMRQGVATDVRNAAVKKLFADPHFNLMDGLDIYIGDYNTPDPLPAGMLEKMVGAQLLNLFTPSEASGPGAHLQPGAPALSPSAQSPAAAAAAPLVAQSPSSTTQALQANPALQATESTEHDDPDLQLQPNHAPANPSAGPSTG